MMGAGGKIVPVILAGGSGTRLWPLSRNSLPKQFLALVTDKTLYQDTLLRTPPGDAFAQPVVITNEEFRFFALRQASEIGIEPTIILEPARRDSAPALLAATAFVRDRYGPEALILALAADHMMTEPEAFRTAVAQAARVAATGHIVTFGILPESPRTSYGYIRPGPALAEGGQRVDAFVEKPSRPVAERYVAEGYLWNSGNFLFPAELMLSEAALFEPVLTAAAVDAAARVERDLSFLRLDPEAFKSAPAKSIDFAVLERTDKAAVVAGDFGWSDIGAWDAVQELGQPDEAGNVTVGAVTLLDSHDSYVRSENGPLVAGIGLDHLIVVATEDAVLVAPARRCQEVKQLVASLSVQGYNAASEHLKVHRPWGTYQTICRGERFHVKKIVVEPGGKLSLQKHHHRSEHWVVVRGTAEVTLGSEVSIVHENQSIYLPIGAVHRLANPGRIPLELIEVQTGSYLGEDDIVRIEDIYHRA